MFKFRKIAGPYFMPSPQISMLISMTTLAPMKLTVVIGTLKCGSARPEIALPVAIRLPVPGMSIRPQECWRLS